jgi:fucose permease
MALRTVGFAGFALFPSWSTVIIAIFISALGAGGIDAGLNVFIARRGTARQINWLHACFGIGATMGPFLAAGVQALGGSWEWNFGVIAIYMAALFGLIWFTASQWQIDASMDTKTTQGDQHAKLMQSLRLPVIWISTALFFFYVGTEITAGQWSFTLFTLGRGIPDLAAKFWVGIYWGIFTVGRILFGLIADKVHTVRAVRTALITSLAGSILLAWNPGGLGIAGLVLMGLAQAPVYPSLIATTVSRVGAKHAQNAIGFQGSAGGVGGTVITSLVGLLAASLGFETIAISVLVMAVLTYLTHEFLLRISPATAIN